MAHELIFSWLQNIVQVMRKISRPFLAGSFVYKLGFFWKNIYHFKLCNMQFPYEDLTILLVFHSIVALFKLNLEFLNWTAEQPKSEMTSFKVEWNVSQT